MTTITKTITANTIETHPNPEAVYGWIRSNWHDLSDHILEEYIECLKAFAGWHDCTVNYSLSVVPDRSESLTFSKPIDYKEKPSDWENLPLTGVYIEHELWSCESIEDVQAVIGLIHDEHDFIYSDEGLLDLLEANGYYFLDDGSFCPEVEAVA